VGVGDRCVGMYVGVILYAFVFVISCVFAPEVFVSFCFLGIEFVRPPREGDINFQSAYENSLYLAWTGARSTSRFASGGICRFPREARHAYFSFWLSQLNERSSLIRSHKADQAKRSQ